MSENLALSELAKRLEQNKKQELEQIKQIETESMSELAQSLRTSLTAELRSIEDDMTERLNKLRTKMSEARQNIIKDEKETLKTLRTNRETIESEAESLMQSLNKVKLRHWLIPTVMGISIVLALVLGTWGTTKYLATQLQTLAELKESQRVIKNYKPVLKVWGNGIEIKKGYQAKLEKTDEGTYFLRLEE